MIRFNWEGVCEVTRNCTALCMSVIVRNSSISIKSAFVTNRFQQVANYKYGMEIKTVCICILSTGLTKKFM